MATTHEQTLNIRGLPTKTVTFYPQKAEIVREIGNVKLKPGFNEIIITGITPIADRNSIKVEAHGSTTVTDMVVEMVANPDSFEEIYPSDSDDSSEDDSDSELEKPQDLKDLEDKIESVNHDRDAQLEIINNSTQSLQILEKMMNKLKFKDSDELESSVNLYHDRRVVFYETLAKAKETKSGLDKKLTELGKRKYKMQNKYEKQKSKAFFKNQKAKEKKQRAKEKKDEVKNRDSVEQAKFWPKKVFQIKVSIESSSMTPGISRTGSFESIATANTILADGKEAEPISTTLSLSYIVTGAFWTPKYDLNISTITQTGIMNYRAEIENTTSETWRDAKVTLSTSRATFSGVSEPIPEINPWLLSLVKSGTFGASGGDPSKSQQEKTASHSINAKPITWNNTVSRNELFGRPSKLGGFQSQQHAQANALRQRQMMTIQAQEGAPAPNTQASSSLFGAPAPPGGTAFGSTGGNSAGAAFGAASASSGGLFGQPAAASFGAPAQPLSRSAMPAAAIPPPPPAPSSLFESRKKKESSTRDRRGYSPSGKDEMSRDEEGRAYGGDESSADEDEESSTPPNDASWEESGLTTTLELRGLRTIPPSSSARQFKIATVRLNQLSLTHIVVPKLKPEAFLRARIVNTSPSSLLKGAAGLTLDGTFLGHTTIPRCSVGENFPLPLGIDPAITVTYPAPVSRKNLSAGVFNKEHSSNYARAVILTNTRTGGAAVSITVKDQVPVSEDEKLKIEILAPRGLHDEGDKVKTGIESQSSATAKIPESGKGNAGDRSGSISSSSKSASASSSASSQSWGSAIAKLNKFGAIEWTVSLNPGKAVRLNLEYAIRYPSTELPIESNRSRQGFAPR